MLDCTHQYYLVHEYRSTTSTTFKKYYAISRKKYCFGHTKHLWDNPASVQRVETENPGERTISEEECAGDKRRSAAYFCKAAAFLCPARSPAAGQGAAPSHANIRKINFSPQWTQLPEQNATQGIALWHFRYLWHDAGSPPLPNTALVLEQPEKKYTLPSSFWLHRYSNIQLWI